MVQSAIILIDSICLLAEVDLPKHQLPKCDGTVIVLHLNEVDSPAASVLGVSVDHCIDPTLHPLSPEGGRLPLIIFNLPLLHFSQLIEGDGIFFILFEEDDFII